MERVFKKEIRLDKILSCILIAMIAIMCLYGSKVYATSIEYNDITYNLIDEVSSMPYILVCIDSSDDSLSTCITCSNSEFNIGITSSGIFSIFPINDTLYYKSGYVKNPYQGNIFDKPFSSYTAISGGFQDSANNINSIVYCNFDLKDKDENVVFQGAPQVLQGIVTTKTVEQIQPTVLETMKKVLPIAIIILALLIALRILPKVLLKFR